jgi:hypothetical protein
MAVTPSASVSGLGQSVATDDLIRRDPDAEWQERWDKFLSDGGVTARELASWMVNGQRIRNPVKRRGGFRLVATGHARVIGRNTST